MLVADVEHGPEETAPLLGALLRIPYQAWMVNAMEPALADAGYGDVRAAHFPVLQALTQWSTGLRATALAARAQITKQSMGYLVDTLAAGGYVERIPDPVDGRAKVVRLTSRGWDVIRTIRDSVRQVEADWARRIGPDEVEHLRTVLQKLVTSLADSP